MTSGHDATRYAGTVAILLAAILVVLTACDRPFVEPEAPRIEIVEPDFSTIFRDAAIDVTVRAINPHAVDVVHLNGDTLTYDPLLSTWTGSISLRDGLNRLVFAAINSDNRTTLDTVFALHARLVAGRFAATLPEPRGGHTATLLQNEALLVTGGAPRISGPAGGSAFLLEGTAFRTLSQGLNEARSGHTATLLPDGRVLILGGTRHEETVEISDLVNTAEVFDSATETFRIIPMRGGPIRRTLHTAVTRTNGGEPVVHLFGGRGDVQYSPHAVFGTRRDIQSFALRGDSLIALTPSPGPYLRTALSGHIQTALDESSPSRYVIAGTNFDKNPRENVSFVLDYRAAQGLAQDTTGRLALMRTRHAAAYIQPGVVGVFGGRGELPGALSDIELYIHSAQRFFRYPASDLTIRRFGHTATKLPSQRILLLGGFSASGEAVADSEIFRAPPL